MFIPATTPAECWLDTIEAGDLVCLVGPRSRNLFRVKRVTATRVVLSPSVQFRLRDGVEVGAIRPRRIEQPTPFDLQQQEARILREFIKRKVDGRITIGKLRALASYLGYKG